MGPFALCSTKPFWIHGEMAIVGTRTPNRSKVKLYIPATVRKLFNLPSSHLTAREAWAGTFEHLVTQQTMPRKDTPATLASPPYSLRHTAVNEAAPLTEFQSELVLLAASLNGGQMMKAAGERMTVAEANFFVKSSVARFLNAGRAHLRAGGDPNAVINVQGLEYELMHG